MGAYEAYISSAISKDEFFYDYFSEVAFAGKTLPDLDNLRIRNFSLEGEELYLDALNMKFPVKVKDNNAKYFILSNVDWDVNCFDIENTTEAPIGSIGVTRTSDLDIMASIRLENGEYIARNVQISLRYNINEKYTLLAKYPGLRGFYTVETNLATGRSELREYDRNEQKLRTDRLYIKCGNAIVEDIPSTQGYYHELDFYDLKGIVETYFI